MFNLNSINISVALCTYNGGQFLGQQIHSILNQSIPVNEIIICDDKSIDDTIVILEKFNQLYSIVSYHQNEVRLGVLKNFEKVIQLCTGDIIFLCDQDDIWEANKVEKTINYFNSNLNKLAVFSDAELVDDAGISSGKTLWSSIYFSPESDGSFNIFKYLCEYRNVITGACLAFKKEALKHFIPFAAPANILHDEWIGLQLSQHNQLGFINEPLIKYRIHPNQQTNKMWQKSEVDKAKFLSLQSDIAEVDAMYHYRHWKKRTLYINTLNELGISVTKEIANEIKKKRKEALIKLVNQKKAIPRKWQLFKYFVKQQESISAADLIKS